MPTQQEPEPEPAPLPAEACVVLPLLPTEIVVVSSPETATEAETEIESDEPAVCTRCGRVWEDAMAVGMACCEGCLDEASPIQSRSRSRSTAC